MKSPHLRLWALCVSVSMRSFFLSFPLTHSHLNPRLPSHQRAHTVRRCMGKHMNTQSGGVRGRSVTPHTDCRPFPSKVHLNSHEVSGSSWVFSDVCNYPVSRQCLVKDKEIHILLRLLSIEEKAWNRPQCLSVVAVNEKVKARPGTEPTSTNINNNNKKAGFICNSNEFWIILLNVHGY